MDENTNHNLARIKTISNSLLNFKKEIMIYFLTRIVLIWVLITYLGSTAFLDDIHVLYFFGTHPFSLITGSFIDAGISTPFGAYAPLEPLIYAPFTAIVEGLNGVRLATFTFEFLTLLMMIIIGNKIIKENVLRKTILIYILIPLSWVENIIWAQDEILAALFLLIVLYFKLKDNDEFAALSLGLTCIIAKIIPLIIFIPLLLTSRDKIKSFILVIVPILTFYIPININYKLLGIENPFFVQISSAGMYSLTIPYLLKSIFGSSIEWGFLAFILLSCSFLVYYSYLIFKYKHNNLPIFIDMLILSFLIYFIFFFGGIHPEHYLFILPILLLRQAMLDKINLKETLLLLTLSVSSIAWKVLSLIEILSRYPEYVKGSTIPLSILEAHNNWIGNQFLGLELIALHCITLILISRYLIIFTKRVIEQNGKSTDSLR